MREDVFAAVSEILAGGLRGALATLVRVGGSTPQQPGARMLLKPDGQFVGTLGGGAVEYLVQDALREVQASGRTQYLVRELGHELGMCCGGRMEIFLEPIEGAPRLWLCGAGHVAQATAKLARSIGFAITVLDEREELNSLERFPECARELREPAAFLRQRTLDERDWVLIATHDHALDERTLDSALQSAPRYIGLIGSRRKVFRLITRLAQRRGALPLERVYAPVGLALGAVGPEEIAVSITAELLALRRNQAAPHLRAIAHPHLQRLLSGEPVPLDAPLHESAHIRVLTTASKT